MRVSWALGTSADYVTHDPAPTGCGQFLFDFTNGAATVYSGRIRATRLIAYAVLFPLVGFLLLGAFVYKIACVAKSACGRWLLHARPHTVACTSSSDARIDCLTMGALSALQGMTFGERAFLLGYLGSIAAFFVMALQEYAIAGKGWVLSFGFASSVQFALALLPVSRTSVFLHMIGIPFERALKWHRVFAGVAALVMLIHAITMIYKNRNDQAVLWARFATVEGAGNLWGTLAGIALTPIVLFSFDPIRRRFFELFLYVHQLFFVGIALAWVHSLSALYLGIFPVAAHLIDRGVRAYRSSRLVTLRGAKVRLFLYSFPSFVFLKFMFSHFHC